MVNYNNVLCCVDENRITDSNLTGGKLGSVGDSWMSFSHAAHSWGMADAVDEFNQLMYKLTIFTSSLLYPRKGEERILGPFIWEARWGDSRISKHFRLWKLLFCFYNLQLVPSGVLATIIEKNFLKIPDDTSFIHVKRNVHSILPYIVVMNSPVEKNKKAPFPLKNLLFFTP